MAIVFVGIDLAKNVFAVLGDLPTGSYLGHRPKTPKHARLQMCSLFLVGVVTARCRCRSELIRNSLDLVD